LKEGISFLFAMKNVSIWDEERIPAFNRNWKVEVSWELRLNPTEK
jgi:hypothetical protein